MDANGIYAHVLYPNLVGFEGHALMALEDRELALAVIRAYNDYLVEFASVAPERFVLMANVPYWDVDASVAELTRCAELGHRGVVWAATLGKHGLPHYSDPYWDRFYAAAQDLGMSINFHVGVGKTSDELDVAANRVSGKPQDRAQRTEVSALFFLSNASTIAHVILSGLCDRFPRLNFVSVESGYGYVPFLLEGLDWQWMNTRGPEPTPPNRLLPSEYFRRQIYSMFWFEETSLPLLGLYPDNVMFETDYPHKTSLAPGEGSASKSPQFYIERAIEVAGEDTMRKVLHDNAARVYRID